MNIEELYKIYSEHSSVKTDTRSIEEGDIFFALKGPNFNGNAFAQQAIKKGAAFAVIDEGIYTIPGKTYLVEDSLNALQALAKHHRRQFTIPFIAITGSNGKTTTKELVHAVLSSQYKTYTTEGNLNNHIGVPLTILKIKKDAEFAIIEMGANHQGEIASYCTIALPTYGLITNCGKAHLEGFGGIEGVRKGKGELFQFLRLYNGGAFVMWDYEYLKKMSKGIQTIFKYGTANAELTGNINGHDTLLQVQFDTGFNEPISTQLVGNYNLPNVLAAVAIGKFFHVPDEKIKAAIEDYSPSNSRSQLIEKGSNKIILDAYNANPSSMKLAIENLSKQRSENKILVIGAMAELGVESLQEHQSIIEEINKHSWKNVLLVGGDFCKIEHPYLKLNSSEEANQWLKENKIRDSLILVKGSRSMKMEKVMEYLQQ